MNTLRYADGRYDALGILARLLMSSLFLLSGFGKLTSVAATQAYMHAYGVPVMLVWPAGLWELAAGALLVVGLWVRPLAILLACWCLLTAAIFHTAFADQNQMVNFLKNVVMAGAFLSIALTGIPGWSLKIAPASPRQV